MNRTPLIVGNWKMELSHKASLALAKSLKESLKGKIAKSEVVFCPSFPSLSAIADLLQGEKIELGAQNIDIEERGANTGQVSVLQISSFVSWCIVGHSETRAFSGESDSTVVQKANLLLRHGLKPIICIGESQQEKDDGDTVEKITHQIEVIIKDIPRVSLLKTVIAYEPIWAIGSGVTPEPDEVSEIVLLIRKILASRFDNQIAERVRILYGGSVKPENAGHYVGGPYADGALVGGASIHAGQFASIIKNIEAVY